MAAAIDRTWPAYIARPRSAHAPQLFTHAGDAPAAAAAAADTSRSINRAHHRRPITGPSFHPSCRNAHCTGTICTAEFTQSESEESESSDFKSSET